MLALEGYYDGKTIQPLEKINAKKNQRLIITVLDDFISETPKTEKKKQQGDLCSCPRMESERAFLSESIYRFSIKKNTLEIL